MKSLIFKEKEEFLKSQIKLLGLKQAFQSLKDPIHYSLMISVANVEHLNKGNHYGT